MSDDAKDRPIAPDAPKREPDDDVLRSLVGVLLGVGILALVLFVGTWWIWLRVTLTGLVLLVLGGGLVALHLFYNADRITRYLAQKRAVVGANVVLMVVLGTAALVLVSAFNGCAEGLTEDSTLGRLGLGRLLKHNLVRETLGRRDLTREGGHELSEQTRKVLGQLDDVLYVLLVDMRDRQSRDKPYQDLYRRVSDLLEEYKYASPDVVVYDVDALADPDQARSIFREAQLVVDDLPTQDTVVLAYGGKRQDLPLDWERFMSAGVYSQSFGGEQVITSGILGLVTEKRKVYFVRGRGEKEPTATGELDYSQVGRALVRNNFSFDSVNLATAGRVPEDCDVLVIAGPRGPFSEPEAGAIDRYLARGGDMLLLVDPREGAVAYGLGAVLGEFGIRARTDTLCMVRGWRQELAGRTKFVSRVIQVPNSEFTTHPVVEPLRNRYNVTLFDACVVSAEVKEGVDAQELLYMPRISMTGQDAPNFAAHLDEDTGDRIDKGLVSEESGDVIGRAPLGVAAERPVEPREGDAAAGKASARVVVIGDSDFALSHLVDPHSPQAVPANLMLFVNAVKWCGERESDIAIEPKTLEIERERADLSRFDTEERGIYERALLVVPWFLLPLLTAFTGFAVWWQRRK